MTYRNSPLAAAFAALLRSALLSAPGLCAIAAADAPANPVQWTASLVLQDSLKRGSDVTVEVAGAIDDGWHVYALDQLPHGPTPLRVTLEPNEVAVVVGPTTGSAAQKEFSASFGLDTRYYTHAFAVRVPVHLNGKLTAGQQLIRLTVRFQACSDRECLLPKTLHLSLPITIL